MLGQVIAGYELHKELGAGPHGVVYGGKHTTLGGIKVAVSSRRVQALDRMVFENFGVDLTAQKIIVLKSTCHYRAHFDPIAETTFAALAPGGHGANPADFAFTKLRSGVRYYPLGPVHEA